MFGLAETKEIGKPLLLGLYTFHVCSTIATTRIFFPKGSQESLLDSYYPIIKLLNSNASMVSASLIGLSLPKWPIPLQFVQG